MNLQPYQGDTIVGKKEYLRNGVGRQYKTGGATLDGSKLTDGQVIKAGTAVFLNTTTGLYEIWNTASTGGTPSTAIGAGLTDHDIVVKGGTNPVVGVLAAGHPLESKCTNVNQAFKDATKGRLVFDI